MTVRRDSPTIVKRIGRTVFWASALIVSLLTFPGEFHWMIAFWIACFCWVEWRRKSGIPIILLIIVLIIIKRPYFHYLGMVLFLPLLVRISIGLFDGPIFGSLDGRQGNDHGLPEAGNKRESKYSRSRQKLMAAILWLSWLVYFATVWVGTTSSRVAELDERSPVVCLGDSLTDYGYPEVLRERLSIPVEDFGFNGYTTTDGIKLLDEIEALQPQVVVLELGGHDYKDGEPRSQTQANLKRIILACHEMNAEVILVEIPRGFISDPYIGLERSLAWRYDLHLVPDTMIRKLIFFGPGFPPGSWLGRERQLSSDGLHPNAQGNQMMADYVCDALEKLFGEAVLVKE